HLYMNGSTNQRGKANPHSGEGQHLCSMASLLWKAERVNRVASIERKGDHEADGRHATGWRSTHPGASLALESREGLRFMPTRRHPIDPLRHRMETQRQT